MPLGRHPSAMIRTWLERHQKLPIDDSAAVADSATDDDSVTDDDRAAWCKSPHDSLSRYF